MTCVSETSILKAVADYYSSRLDQHGPTSRGVDWNGPESHSLRHHQFMRLLDGNQDASVLDLGCGFGDFFRFLRQQGHRGAYVGYDVAPNMIKQAQHMYGGQDGCRWQVGAKPSESADFAVASGIFNVKGDFPAAAWASYVRDTIDILASAGRRGFGFNMLSLSSDPERRRPDLYYADAVGIFAECLQTFGRSVAVLQDYGLYEFTVIVRR